MCMIDDCDERVEMFKEEQRKARKPHKCDECSREIAAGEKYQYEFGKLEGEPFISKTCSHCMVAREWLQINCGGWVFCSVIEEIQEHAKEYPNIAFPLTRIVVGAQRKWKSFHGGLMVLPKMPPELSTAEI